MIRAFTILRDHPMHRRLSSVLDEDQPSDLQSFIVFDGIVPKYDGADPVVLFEHAPGAGPHYSVNQAGLMLAFLKFSRRFARECPCDYIVTRSQEFSVLELSNNVWMAVARHTTVGRNRNLMNSILRSCKNIYELFFQEPQRAENGELNKKSKDVIKDAFTMIVQAITWTDLAFVHLFDSFFQLRLPNLFLQSLWPKIERVMQEDSPVSHIAILHSRFFLFDTFPTDVAKTLAICLRIKFPYLFPRVIAKEEEQMYWIIGMSSSDGMIHVYTPPIWIGGKQYQLVALRWKKLRIILALKPECAVSPELLAMIPRILKELIEQMRHVGVETVSGKKSGPYIVIRNHRKEKMLCLSHEKLSDTAIPVAENAIFMGQAFATNVGSPNACVAFPGPLDFFVYFKLTMGGELVIMYRDTSKKVSAAIAHCEELAKEENVKCSRVKVSSK